MKSKMAMATPKPDAAIKLSVLATKTTETITKKSRRVSLDRANLKLCQSIILYPMTINKAPRHAVGTHAMKGVRTAMANKDHMPWNTPER